MGLVDIDVMMAIIFFVIGGVFYLSKGKAVIFLSGYNTLPKEREKDKEYEKMMCKIYGKRLFVMGIPFVLGAIIDSIVPNVGCILAWVAWFVLLVLLIIQRYKLEK